MCDNARECEAAKRAGFGTPVEGDGATGDAARAADGVQPARSLVDKLGVRPGMRVAVSVGVDGAVESLVRGAAAEVTALGDEGCAPPAGSLDAVFLQVADRSGLAAVASLPALLARDGMLWVLWPKGRGQVGQGDVQRAGLDAGLVDVKVASVSESLSGLKFVYRLRDR